VLGVGVVDGRRVGLAVVEDTLGDQPHQSLDPLAVVAEHRQVERQHPVAELLAALGERVVEVGPLVVQPRDRDRPRHADGGALLPERGRGGVHAVDGGDDEQRGVGGAQARAQLADEIGVARDCRAD
jgi:hypothetical protein